MNNNLNDHSEQSVAGIAPKLVRAERPDEAVVADPDSVSRRGFVRLAAAAAAAGAVALSAGCAPTTQASAADNKEKYKQAVPKEAPVQSTGIASTPYEIVDNHLHYLDFIQRTDGISALIEKMDEAGVSQAVLFGMAMAKQWDEDADNIPAYYLSNDSRTYYYSGTDFLMMEQLQAATAEQRARFLPFICGVNPNDRFAAEHIYQLLQLYPNQFVGIGELMSRHDDLTALTYGEPPHLDHPAFLEIFDMAAGEGLPVLIHHNIAGSYMDDPIYLDELRAGLAHNRNTHIIWAHVGISRRVEVTNLTEIVDDLLKQNNNLSIDLSWVVYDDYINKDEESLQTWAGLIERYADRFMIGTDCVGHWKNYTQTVQRYYTLLDKLSPEAATLVAKENILAAVKHYPA